MSLSRREFINLTASGTAVLGFGGTTPQFLTHAAMKAKSQEKILVVVQLSGGNDGLNTVVPFENDDYKKARPSLAVSKKEALKINDELGFHPVLKGFSNLYNEGQLAIVQGVGYPHPNRSHFESMDFWHTCKRKNEKRDSGWLGRCIDQLQQADPIDIAALHLGKEKQPLSLLSRTHRVPSVRSLEQFRLNVSQQESVKGIRNLIEAKREKANSLLDFVQASTETAIDVSKRFERKGKSYQPKAAYPETALGEKLKTVAQLIESGLQTNIYYVELAGFDTHSQQDGAHVSLLRQLGDAVSAFNTDISKQGHADRVLTVCFSEFGRRVAENASKGTDHGTAAPMFLVGNRVNAGLIGKQPSLKDLDEGDLRFHTDFRQIYAAILENWLGCNSKEILGGAFKPVSVLKT